MQNDYCEILEERVRTNPGSPLFLSLAEEYRRRGRFDEACAVIEKGVERNPGLDVAHLILSRWYTERDMYDRATHSLLRLLEYSPDNLQGHKLLAQIYSEIGALYEAADEYHKAYAIDPHDPDVKTKLQSLGRFLDTPSSGDPDIQAAKTVRKADFPQDELGIREVEDLMSQGRYRKALDLLNDIATSDSRTLNIISKREELIAQIADAEKVQAGKIDRLNTLMDSVKRHFMATGSK